MRRVIASTFVSLDGILQAPGGPEEDPTGGFVFGGWMFPHADESMDMAAAGFDAADRELLLGRRTYEIFEAYWPYQAADNPIAKSFNATRKHVASRTRSGALEWHNAALLEGEAATAVAELKRSEGPDLQIIGSGGLIQSLQAAALIDEYHVWTFPVVLGTGKRLFAEGARPAALRLVRSQVSGTGVVMSAYEPDGNVRTGSFIDPAIPTSERELARRQKMADGGW